MTVKITDSPLTSKRIYCIVAQTVQAPLDSCMVYNPALKRNVNKLVSVEGTQTIVQPAGRLIAQAAHVVSKARLFMLVHEALRAERNGSSDKLGPIVDKLTFFNFTPITTIILSARDSFELNHVLNLLHEAKVPVHTFKDTDQPDYGSPDKSVMTAIATEPVTPQEVVGILDYLSLWGSEKVRQL